jgi:outer membrane protein assembly factor BamB
MIKNVQRWILLSVVLGLAGCAGTGGVKSETSEYLIDPQLLSAAGMEEVWHNQLPLKPAKTKKSFGIFKRETAPAEELKRLVVLGNRVYALSDQNYFMSLNRNTGNLVFSKNIAPASFAVRGMDLYGNEIVSVIANRLVEIDPEFGTEKKVSELPYGVVGTAARNSNFFYIAGTDNHLHVMRAYDKLPLFQVGADDDSTITAINAGDDYVVFGTSSGLIEAMEPDQKKRLWRFQAGAAVAGDIVRHKGAIYFASRDTNVYKLDGATGQLEWKYPAGAILEVEPLVTDNVVYQYAGRHGLAGIGVESGEMIWQVDKGVDLLAESNGKAYVITEDGKMVVMDNRTGRRLHAVNFAGVGVYATNVQDSKIYVGGDEGLVACIKPVE